MTGLVKDDLFYLSFNSDEDTAAGASGNDFEIVSRLFDFQNTDDWGVALAEIYIEYKDSIMPEVAIVKTDLTLQQLRLVKAEKKKKLHYVFETPYFLRLNRNNFNRFRLHLEDGAGQSYLFTNKTVFGTIIIKKLKNGILYS